MASVLSLATAVPEHRLDTAEALERLGGFWPQLERLDLADVSVGTRYTCEPVAALLAERRLGDRNRAYAVHARRLAAQAATCALERAGLPGSEVDAIVTVSCTGYVVPALDVQLAADLGLRPDVIRLPITELGCSGGAAALALAHRHCLAFPEQNVLVVAVELPSLTFQPADRSLGNLTACLVFGDGAGAAVLTGRSVNGLQVLDAASRLVPGTAHLLGFDLRDHGFHVVLDRRVPRVLERQLGPAVASFLGGPAPADLGFLAVHAGGSRILDAVESALHLRPQALRASREVFARVGNTSSASIFFTLERVREMLGHASCEGLGLGLGPGLSVELMRLAWVPSEHAGDEARAAGERLPVGG